MSASMHSCIWVLLTSLQGIQYFWVEELPADSTEVGAQPEAVAGNNHLEDILKYNSHRTSRTTHVSKDFTSI
jgi:hypothetical protein